MPALIATIQCGPEVGGVALAHDGRFDSRQVQIRDARRAARMS